MAPKKHHISFWMDLIGRLGPPIVAATLVVCLMELEFNPVHLGLIAAGIAMIGSSHWFQFHHG